MNEEIEKIYFGGGCFWCTEAVFKMLKGVISVYPGYSGGTKINPTYLEVSSGNTGYVEVVYVEYDKSKIKFEDLLTVFFASHNPTEKNRQGGDIGTQYRSVIFYTNEDQKKIALDYIDDLNKTGFGDKIVTTVEPFSNFYIAEDYHLDYYNKNKEAPYCQVVINPKLEKVQKRFANLLI